MLSIPSLLLIFIIFSYEKMMKISDKNYLESNDMSHFFYFDFSKKNILGTFFQYSEHARLCDYHIMFGYDLIPDFPKGHLHLSTPKAPLHKQKNMCFFMTVSISIFWKKHVIFKFLVLQEKIVISQNTRLWAFVEKVWQNLM